VRPSINQAAVSLAVVAMLFSCADGPGSYSVTFTFEPPTAEVVWLSLEVQHRVDGAVSGPVLASSEMAAYVPGTGLSMSLPSVPNGSDRVVVVEGREVKDANARPIYYGFSGPFTIVPGKATTVEVSLLLQPPETDKHPSAIAIGCGSFESTPNGRDFEGLRSERGCKMGRSWVSSG